MWNWKETIKNIIQKRPSISLYLTVYWCTHLTNQTQESKNKKLKHCVLRFVWSYFILLIYLRAF